jgi:hypothetical protein
MMPEICSFSQLRWVFKAAAMSGATTLIIISWLKNPSQHTTPHQEAQYEPPPSPDDVAPPRHPGFWWMLVLVDVLSLVVVCLDSCFLVVCWICCLLFWFSGYAVLPDLLLLSHCWLLCMLVLSACLLSCSYLALDLLF